MPVTYAIAGLLCGLTEALVINPFEVVKVKLQAEKSLVIMKQKSAYATAREIIHREGFGQQGLNKGLTSTLGRHGVWNMVYFFLYHSLREKYPPKQDRTANLVQRFSFGLLAGTVASIINIPLDVAKSRVQGPQPTSGAVKYRGCFRSMNIIRKEEGF
uniref:Mitochondrial 2-oxodicarboxylate carrier n=1 Tax=Romanomermis culicivorax TaxID=13658 RepID=A0A915HW56_ROMCU